MKYAFVSISILFMWLAILLIIVSLNYDEITLPLLALVMTIILFSIGFGGKK